MTYSIKEAAGKLSITKHTLYYYEKAELLPPIQRDERGNRVYTDSDISWVYLICCLRDINMPIQLIRSYVKLLLDETSTLEKRKEILLLFQQKIEADLQHYSTIQQLIKKKLAFYDQAESPANEAENCYDYKKDWVHFKLILEEGHD
ncbi:MerR family transcriptional regulator [Candidatus Enterococcus ferrettii]|uniref:HTH merR-type domain-containing protein n=1 Tax=Candidatus Enterococcus ferrettii TaxID=2815324 RepID=A0ABV0EPF9_9ENTE|nr:MerR family transcriptional regulator [Enterococcus sp. 665A]MBO1343125.1 MerR family transcriptional regulator [Enterococcus sp. 665A]